MTIAIDINDVIRDNLGQFLKVYQNNVDGNFELELSEVTTNNMLDYYPFDGEESLAKFKYIDYPYELYGRAQCCDKMLPYILNDWTEKTLKDVSEEYVPDIMFFSPFEIALSIQSTFAFLSGNTFRPREVYFPINSMTIYDKADIVITAQPNLIKNCPEGKTVIKIEKSYNRDIETKYSFKSLKDLIQSGTDTIINILTHDDNGKLSEN